MRSGPARRVRRRRMVVAGILSVGCFLALFTRLVHLQVAERPAYAARAEANRWRVLAVEAGRGRILDREGRVLADSRSAWRVRLDRRVPAGERPALLQRLAPVLGVPAADLGARVADPAADPVVPVTLLDDVPEDVVVALRERQGEWAGVEIDSHPIRRYPHGRLAAHVLGTLGAAPGAGHPARRGASGVEMAQDATLAGRAGETRIEVDSAGRPVRTVAVRDAHGRGGCPTHPRPRRAGGGGAGLGRRHGGGPRGPDGRHGSGRARRFGGGPRRAGRVGPGPGVGAHVRARRPGGTDPGGDVGRPPRPGRPRPAHQPGAPGALRPRLHLQAGDRPGGARGRSDHSRDGRRRPGHIPPRQPPPPERPGPRPRQGGPRPGDGRVQRRVLLRPRGPALQRPPGRRRRRPDPGRRRPAWFRPAERDRHRPRSVREDPGAHRPAGGPRPPARRRPRRSLVPRRQREPVDRPGGHARHPSPACRRLRHAGHRPRAPHPPRPRRGLPLVGQCPGPGGARPRRAPRRDGRVATGCPHPGGHGGGGVRRVPAPPGPRRRQDRYGPGRRQGRHLTVRRPGPRQRPPVRRCRRHRGGRLRLHRRRPHRAAGPRSPDRGDPTGTRPPGVGAIVRNPCGESRAKGER